MPFWSRWFPAPEAVPLTHGVPLTLKRVRGRWEIHGDRETFQAGAYMDGLWTKVFATLPASGAPTRVLLLGVAMGGTFNLILKRWPNARIVGVDWEPDLLALGRRLGVTQENPRITFVSGDAVRVVPTIEGPFDLIVVDLFNGLENGGGIDLADAVTNPALQDACVERLAPGGTLALNHFRSQEATKGWDERLPSFTRMKYGGNTITVYKKLP